MVSDDSVLTRMVQAQTPLGAVSGARNKDRTGHSVSKEANISLDEERVAA